MDDPLKKPGGNTALKASMSSEAPRETRHPGQDALACHLHVVRQAAGFQSSRPVQAKGLASRVFSRACSLAARLGPT
eukprot:2739841-Pyramimonas_sp.AAC.1